MSDRTKFFAGLVLTITGVLVLYRGLHTNDPKITLFGGLIALTGVFFWILVTDRQPKPARRRLQASDMFERPRGAHISRDDISAQPAPRPLATYDRPDPADPAEYHPHPRLTSVPVTRRPSH